jgi:hypothetical protein
VHPLNRFAASGVKINTMSAEEIEENLAAAAQGETRQSCARSWTDQEIEDVFMARDDPTVRDLFLFAKQEGLRAGLRRGRLGHRCGTRTLCAVADNAVAIRRRRRR